MSTQPEHKFIPTIREQRAIPHRHPKYIDLVVEDSHTLVMFRAVTADLSTGGMRVMTDQYLPATKRFTFTMRQHPALAVRGEVRWIRSSEQKDTYHCGVEFIDVSDIDRERLQQFLESERQRGSKPGWMK